MQAITQSQLTFDSGGKAIRLDAFLPENGGNPMPAVVALHGAGGDVKGMDKSAALLAEQGFAVYVLHYFDRTGLRIRGQGNYPPQFSDLDENTVGCDQLCRKSTDRLIATVLRCSVSRLEPIFRWPTRSIDNRVRAVVEFFGGFPREMKLFMKRFCPVLILHGDADPTVPVAEAYQLRDLLEKKNIPYEIKIYSGAGHGFDSDVWRDAGPRVLRFLQNYTAAKQQR